MDRMRTNECKFYAGTLQKGLGRAFVGFIDDMGSNLRISGFCSNSEHPQLKEYFRPQRRPHPHFRLTPLEPSNDSDPHVPGITVSGQ
jgi:hypothetical protein